MASLLCSKHGQCDSIIPLCVDVGNVKATLKAFEGVGNIDLLVNNAGIARLAPFLDAKPDDFDE